MRNNISFSFKFHILPKEFYFNNIIEMISN